MTIYYVSSKATNGYAMGDDANDGLSKSSPWLSLDPMNAVGFIWTGDDTVYVNGATECSEKFVVDNHLTINGVLDSDDSRPRVTLLSVNAGSDTNALAFSGGFDLSVADIFFDGTAASTSVLRLDYPVVAGSVTLTRTGVSYTAFGIYASNGAIDLTLTDCDIESTTNEHCAIYIDDLLAGANITIDGLALNLSGAPTADRGGIYIEANAAGVTASIKRVSGGIVSTTGAGYCYGVRVVDCDTATIESCDLSITPHTNASATLYCISCPSIALVSGEIINNRGVCNSRSGIIIRGGSDSAADNTDGIVVSGNRVRGPTNYTTLHGILVGNCADATVEANYVRYAFIAFISKQSVNHVVSHNVARGCISTAVAFQAKGADGCTFVGNLQIVEGDYNGRMFYVHDNAGNFSTGVVIAGNARWAAPGAAFYSSFLSVETSNAAEFYANNWYVSPPGVFPNTPFSYLGVTYSLDNWKALSNVHGDTSFRFLARGRTRERENRELSLLMGL